MCEGNKEQKGQRGRREKNKMESEGGREEGRKGGREGRSKGGRERGTRVN